MRLYALTRVEAAESTVEFIAAKTKAARRVNGAKAAADTKRTALMQQIERMTVKVALVNNVTARAIKSYNAWNWEKQIDRDRDFPPASFDSDPDFLQRITVNYIRHELTDYDLSILEAAKKVGADDARVAIKQKVLAAISAQYPALKLECDDQSSTAGDLWRRTPAY
jgi:hypothetical protein